MSSFSWHVVISQNSDVSLCLLLGRSDFNCFLFTHYAHASTPLGGDQHRTLSHEINLSSLPWSGEDYLHPLSSVLGYRHYSSYTDCQCTGTSWSGRWPNTESPCETVRGLYRFEGEVGLCDVLSKYGIG